MLTMTLWNANGCNRYTVDQTTNSLLTSSLIFITETWLLSPLRLMTLWQQYHTYGIPLEGQSRGQMGISLLVNPDCPYPVTHFPSDNPYVLSCQVSTLLVHCVYLPPSLTDQEAMEILDGLPHQTHPSQTNMVVCGDFNARHQHLLGDSRTTTRGIKLFDWILENGMTCWNTELAYGIPTYCAQGRVNANTGEHFNSVIDLFLSSQQLVNPKMLVHEDLSLGSDHHPVSLSCVLPPPPPPPAHPRRLWNLSRLTEPDSLYVGLFRDRIQPFRECLTTYASPTNTTAPDMDVLANELTSIIHSCLDDSVGQRKPRGSGNAWFWTDDLQTLFDRREQTRRKWKRAAGINKVLRWQEYEVAAKRFKSTLYCRRRATWKQFCETLSSGPLSDTTATIKRIRRNRTLSPSYSHPEGPTVAAVTMANHLQQVFSGSSLPSTRYNAPPIPSGPHCPDDDPCPVDTETVRSALLKRLSRRKAPGCDHLRTEMLLPIADDLVPVLTLLFRLCWIWSAVPAAWCTAQVVPIYKKGDPLQPANYRPISLTSVLRKLFELCLQTTLEDTAPPLDPVQGGFRHSRSALDQALCLNELCRQHAIDHHGEPPVLAFLDIKSAYDTVDRAIIWRALETYVSPALLGLLQCLFDKVSIEVLISGYTSPAFWPRTGVLQGSILSPFLYSIYINSLPALLRSVRLPVSARYYSSNPQREFDGLWLNCLLYADDVVLIGAAEVMPRLLKAAEEHSFSLGYRWNPAKCVMLNCAVSLGGPQFKLYGDPIPIQSTFNYLGVPFDDTGTIATGLLIQRNVTSAVSAMRRFLLPVGIRSPGFSRLTAVRLYAIFIRPRFEYGLCICTFLQKQLALLDRAQDQCLRLAFGGHPRASTTVFKHLTSTPSMHVRAHTLVLKMIIRVHHLPDDCLLAKLVPSITAAPIKSRFRWPMLLKQNPLWSSPQYTGGYTSVDDRLSHLSTDARVKKSVLAYRTELLDRILGRPDPPVLLSACRPSIGVDGVFLIPMLLSDRSRILRWRMGWLPARPIDCSCGPIHASRAHLLSCLRVAERLNLPADIKPNPLDYVLNMLPKKLPAYPSEALFSRWSLWWPVVCQVLLEIEQICLPEGTFTGSSIDTSGSLFLDKIRPLQLSSTVDRLLFDSVQD